MKRPQGFERSPARSESPRAVETVTDPIPVQAPSAPTTGAGSGTREAPDRSGTDSSPYSRLPSNREIDKALRAARRERKRLERGEVRRFTKRSRRRRYAWLGAAAVVVALVLAVVLVAFSPLLDQAGISSDLAAFPLIRSYTVESHPPDSIVIRVVERQPVGVIQRGNAFTLVDAAKVPIASSEKRPDGFPLIAAGGGAADVDADSGFAAAASVLSALPADVLAQVDTIAAKTKDDVSFTLRGSGATVVWGSAEDSSLKAADLAALLKSAPESSRFDVSSPHSVTTG